MDRLTNKNVDVKPMRGALGEFEHAHIPGIKERFLDLILNGPTLNGVNKDLLRSLVRQLYEALKQYEDAEQACRDAEERGNWISVKDALPEPSQAVLALFSDGFMMQCSVPFVSAITHWMPRPAPPEKGADGQ